MSDLHSTIEIKSHKGSYCVEFMKLEMNRMIDDWQGIVLCDERVAKSRDLQGSKLILVPAEEQNKNLACIDEVVGKMMERGASRGTNLLVIGGGLLQDLGGSLALLFMRGISWTFVPTTLQSMADSCIGGKTSINSNAYKNVLGGIHPPHRVLVDISFTRTLSLRDLSCGVIEGLKIVYASKSPEFSEIARIGRDMVTRESSENDLHQFIHTSLVEKKAFIEEDEFDMGKRRLLNYGHTFGHAIESATNHKVHHGVAVGIGILASFRLDESEKTEREKLLFDTILNIVRVHRIEIARAFGGISWREKFLTSLVGDKKATANEFKFIHSVAGNLEIKAIEKSAENLSKILSIVEETLEGI
jgi:3-dehydroquinate synthase